jgi:hypothetical protein
VRRRSIGRTRLRADYAGRCPARRPSAAASEVTHHDMRQGEPAKGRLAACRLFDRLPADPEHSRGTRPNSVARGV